MLRSPFPHTEMHMRLFRGLAFTKFIIRTTSSSTGARFSGKSWAMSASWEKKKKKEKKRKKKCATITSGCLSFTQLTNPFVRPTMAAAPSVQTSMQFSHVSPPCSRYSDATRNIFSPVVFWQCLAKREDFTDGVSVHKTHIGQKLSIATDVRRLIKL